MLNKIIDYYMLGIYKEKHMKKLVEAGAMTQEEYNVIVNGGV